jgi:hypothetical protein
MHESEPKFAGRNENAEDTMTTVYSEAALENENRKFLGTGGRSQENRSLGFCPAFMDAETGIVYRSCFSNGQPAPCHLLDGLPDEVVLTRDLAGRVVTVKSSMVSGFVLDQRFYSREQAAARANRVQIH